MIRISPGIEFEEARSTIAPREQSYIKIVFPIIIVYKLNLNLEPVFKYQLNTFTNTSGDFRPYFVGFYTGLSFKF